MNLPEEFKIKMKGMLGEEYGAYCKSYEEDTVTALRVNTLKISPEDFVKSSPFSLTPIPWTENGFYYDAMKDRPSKHPYYYAGLYYIQEPSAMIPASLLPIEEGDVVLDLCAAPGGKATELAAKLKGTGMLVANDISVSRAMALAKNLQMTGAGNVVVTAETPENLSGHFPAFFDKIIVDAPCSGEGMFRRDNAMIKDWVEKGPSYYVVLQKQILSNAYEMLRPGGKMVYSTCTFDVSEDEGMIQSFLQEHSDMKICPVKRFEEFSEGRPDLLENGMEELKNCVRIFPHHCKGEGHFAVLLQKEPLEENGRMNDSSEEISYDKKRKMPSLSSKKKNQKNGKKEARGVQSEEDGMEFFTKGLPESIVKNISFQKEKGYCIPEKIQGVRGLRYIQNGLFIGEKKKNRFEPSTQLALTLTKEKYPYIVDLPVDDERVIRYLKGETIFFDGKEKGYVLICVNGFPLGFGKANGSGMIKNKYYAGWRMM